MTQNLMRMIYKVALVVSAVVWMFVLSVTGFALARPGVEFKIFQFPADKIPRIDGDTSDWSMVPEAYAIGMDQLKETVKGRGFNYDKKDLDVKVKVGWVKGSIACTFCMRPTIIFGISTITAAITTSLSWWWTAISRAGR